jgi:hypothetical protein
MNIEDAENIIDGIEELQLLAVPVARQLLELETGSYHSVDEDDIDVRYGCLRVTYGTSCCGEWEDNYETIPLEYLFDDNWMVEAKAEMERRKVAEAEALRIKKAKAKAAADNSEREQYLALKAKYGDA